MGQRIPEPIWESMKEHMPDILDSMHMTFSWALITKIFWTAVIGMGLGLGAKNVYKRQK